MTTAIELARYIVNKCVEDNHPITNLQLQKILYYIQRDYLKKHNTRAFMDHVEAWQFGPVVPDVYYAFCYYGAMPIENCYDNTTDMDIDDLDMVDRIVEEKRDLEPWDMVNDTHKRGGAWDKTYKDGAGNRSTINIDLIRRDK
ncbi:MAG: DUF4065 domain-containing protein [Ruminococcaceae bacterium]|nr:DUF4065 domain-containing protein [Oscillospiraceae bacterium]